MANCDRNVPSRLAPVITVVLLLLIGSLVPKGGGSSDGSLRSSRTHEPSAARFAKQRRLGEIDFAPGRKAATANAGLPAAYRGSRDLTAYDDLGSWIDIYDEWPWAHPNRAVRELHRRGVGTIFLQTSNWGAERAIFRPHQTEKFLRSAHRRGMKVVSWYVPSFAKPKDDYDRSRAAILFERKGHRFDSFGLDIESTVVGDIALRNRRLLALSHRLRRLVGRDYTLGAITPDPVEAVYWPNFPYKKVAKVYDVFVPMGYFSFRTNGYRAVKKYALTGIRNIRRSVGDRDVAIHLIGGIGGETRVPEVKAFVRAVKGNDVVGGSYYDMTVTSEEEWEQLRRIADGPRPPSEPEETPAAVPEPRPTRVVAPASSDAATKKNHNDRDHKNRKRKNTLNNKESKNDDNKKKWKKSTNDRTRRNGNG